jgi:hypothetical protein
MTSRIGFSLLGLAFVAACSGRNLTAPRNPAQSSRAEATRAGLNAEASESFPRRGALHIKKNCKDYTGLAGSFCTITSSNVAEIDSGSKVIYKLALGAGLLDTDVTLDPPGPGNNKAFGHCRLDLQKAAGVCSFSGGTGKFAHFSASAAVSFLGDQNWAWEGTYSFDRMID